MEKRAIQRFMPFISAALLLTGGQALAAMQLPAPDARSPIERVTPVTFWAHPYPYRYSPRHECPLVRVATPHGWYWDRVCATDSREVLRRAY